MDETGRPWPGFTFRFANASNFEIDSNTPAKSSKKSFPITTTEDVVIKRVSGILYISVNGETEQEVIDYSKLAGPIYVPLTVGASLTGSLTPQRYFTGKLSNISIHYLESTTTGD